MPSIKSILSKISNGKDVFGAENLELEGLEKFKPIARILLDCENQGWLKILTKHQSSSHIQFYDLFQVVLTEHGKQYLAGLME